MIEFSQVTAGYPGREVLHGIDLNVPEGKITSLIGPNGCGKTTLLKTACGLLPLRSGEIRFGGRSIRDFPRKEFARLAAVLPQVRDIPAIRVGSFVAHGRYPHLSFGRDLTARDRELVEQAMEETGVLPLRDKELSGLSGGERQRAYLAMTLAQDAQVLFLDEPTTYLDIGQKYEMLELVKRVNARGKTIVMVLHDLSFAFSYSDQVAVMQDGALLLSGPAEEVFDSGVPSRAFGVTARKAEIDGTVEYMFLKSTGSGV